MNSANFVAFGFDLYFDFEFVEAVASSVAFDLCSDSVAERFANSAALNFDLYFDFDFAEAVAGFVAFDLHLNSVVEDSANFVATGLCFDFDFVVVVASSAESDLCSDSVEFVANFVAIDLYLNFDSVVVASSAESDSCLDFDFVVGSSAKFVGFDLCSDSAVVVANFVVIGFGLWSGSVAVEIVASFAAFASVASFADIAVAMNFGLVVSPVLLLFAFDLVAASYSSSGSFDAFDLADSVVVVLEGGGDPV